MRRVSNEVPPSVDGAAITRSLATPEAFTVVFDRHFVAVHRYLARRVGRDRADDLAAQTFLLAFAQRGRYRDELGTARPWLLGIATNLLRAEHRAEQRRLATLQAIGRETMATAEATNGHPDAGLDPDVAAAVAALDPVQRDALLLHVWGELSYTDVLRPRLTFLLDSDTRGSPTACAALGRRPEGEVMLDELELVRALAADEPDPSEVVVAAARGELLGAISAAAVVPAARPPRGRRHQRRRLLLAVGITAGAVAIAGSLGLTTATGPQTALAAAMNRLARIAASQAWTGIPAPGQYMYTASEAITESDTIAKSMECQIAQRGSSPDLDRRRRFRRDLRDPRPEPLHVGGRSGDLRAGRDTDPSSQDSSSSNSFPPGGLSSRSATGTTCRLTPQRS